MANIPARISGSGWKDRIGEVVPVVGSAQAEAGEILNRLDRDLETLRAVAGSIFWGDTSFIVEMIRNGHKGDAPSLTALAVFAIENLGLSLPPEIERALLATSVMGETAHDNAYHNSMHFRKVLLQAMRMIAAHNRIYKGTDMVLDGRRAGLLLIAACIHDLGHDGKGNYVEGVLVPGRLEKRSFELARPVLDKCGISDGDADWIRVMVRCTEVVPLGGDSSPMNQMKRAYLYHRREKTGSRPEVDSDLSDLKTNADLALMALLLHESDIGTSAGLCYEVTIFENGLVAEEYGLGAPKPSDIINFLGDAVCGGQMLSAAGKELYGANMASIYAAARRDFEAGNHHYSAQDTSGLLRPSEI